MKCMICRRPIEGKGLISKEFGITHTGCSFQAYKEKYGKKLQFEQIYPFNRWYRFKMRVYSLMEKVLGKPEGGAQK